MQSIPRKVRSRKSSKMGRGTRSCLKSQSLLRISKHRKTSSKISLWTTKRMKMTREAPRPYQKMKIKIGKKQILPIWGQKEVQTGNVTKRQYRIKDRKNERRRRSRKLVSSKTFSAMTLMRRTLGLQLSVWSLMHQLSHLCPMERKDYRLALWSTRKTSRWYLKSLRSRTCRRRRVLRVNNSSVNLKWWRTDTDKRQMLLLRTRWSTSAKSHSKNTLSRTRTSQRSFWSFESALRWGSMGFRGQ